jgi:hypothetical protein
MSLLLKGSCYATDDLKEHQCPDTDLSTFQQELDLCIFTKLAEQNYFVK